MVLDPNIKPSPRELQVAKLIAAGNCNKEAADVLGISVRTVETHRSKLMHKMGFRCAADITRWVMQEHLIEGSNDESTSSR